jgi:hypothetical protein
MAISFQTFKKNMSIDYVKMGFTPLRNTSRRNVNIGMHSCSISCWRTVRSKQEGTKKMKAKAALPSSWARRLFGGDSEMAEDGRRPDCKRN